MLCQYDIIGSPSINGALKKECPLRNESRLCEGKPIASGSLSSILIDLTVQIRQQIS